MVLCSLIVVLGLQVFIGNSGVYSFGQIAFAAVGAYLGALLTLSPAFAAFQTPNLPAFIADAQLGVLPALLAAAVACGLLATLVGLPLMRTSTLAIPISTFAFLIVTYDVLGNWNAVTGGSGGLVDIPRSTSLESAGFWAIIAALVALAFKWSPAGYRLQATREDEVAARSIGIAVTKERMLAFGLSGVLCGIGGSLAVHESGVLTPTTFYFGATVTTLTMLIVGGGRGVFGAVAGGLAVATVNELLRNLEEGASLFGLVSIGSSPGLAAIGLGLILLATMILLPDGLSGGREAGEFDWVRRLLESEARTGSAARGPATARDRSRPTGERSAATNGQRSELELRGEGISVAFAGLQVLLEVDLTLRPGTALGLIGPNGAGKTTLVNVLSGFQALDAGRVRLDGRDVTRRSPERLARVGLARTFQAALPFPHLSALEGVAVGAMGVGASRRKSVKIASEVMERLGLQERVAATAGSLPPGEQRLLGVARALATGPRYLLLDEPAAGLNEAERRELVGALRGVLADFGCGILLIEHDLSVVMELCPRVQVLDDGHTVSIGAPEEVQADPAVIESYLGSSFAAVADA